MLDYLNDNSSDDNANPAYWGPFAWSAKAR